MDEEGVRAQLHHYWEYSGRDADVAHEIYHEDATLEFPQSGERFEGLENFREWRRRYPASVTAQMRRIRGSGDVWVSELSVSYDGGETNFGVSILEYRGDKIVHETIYVTQGWDAPEWRAPWRAQPDTAAAGSES